jgi:tetrachlorobenzoquinone reductase
VCAALKSARIRSIAYEAPSVLSFELADPLGVELPAFRPGAHVDLHLPNGISRSYSLIGAPDRFDVYRIGVALEPSSRGASRWLHESARPGDVMKIAEPRNQFALVETAPLTVLIGGGIGMTPLIGMAERLDRLGLPFKMYLGTRSRIETPFMERLAALGNRVEVAFSREPAGRRLDIASLVASAPYCAHLYCCGPKAMIEDFERAAVGRRASHIHVERFSPAQESALEGGFVVELARSGVTIAVPSGKTILDSVLEAGIETGFSCMEGVCGSCETKVLAGTPDHRDAILSPAERAANDTMMICCSGAKTERLTLDL